jgi:curved DNA-binding protein CbpA
MAAPSDNFAIFGEQRRPWLSPDALKQKFLALCGQSHPDRCPASPHDATEAQARFTALNTAYNCLREPRTRLRHLLELELGQKPSELQQVPAKLMNMFAEQSRLCREADRFLAERSQAASPLLKVQLWENGQIISDKLIAWQASLNSAFDDLITQLKKLDDLWETRTATTPEGQRSALLERLSELYRLFSYYGRWISQTQERIVQLSLE